jgi:uncharacterized RDD family membrane protein YckC
LVAYIVDSLITAALPTIVIIVGLIAVPKVDATCYSTDSSGYYGSPYSCSRPEGGPLAVVIIAAIVVLLVVAYLVMIAPVGRTGQSIGRSLVNIRVVDADTRQPIGLGRAFGRFLAAQFLSRWFCSLGYLWMLFNGRKQTWHDLIVSSVVVKV